MDRGWTVGGPLCTVGGSWVDRGGPWVDRSLRQSDKPHYIGNDDLGLFLGGYNFLDWRQKVLDPGVFERYNT